MLKHLKEEDFNEEVKTGDVLVDFYATWCGPCKMLEPVIEEFAEARGKVKVIEVDIDEHEDLAREHGIMAVPTLLVYRDGKLVNKQSGFVTKDILESWYKEENR